MLCLQAFLAVRSTSPGVSQQTSCTRFIFQVLLTVALSHLELTQVPQSIGSQ